MTVAIGSGIALVVEFALRRGLELQTSQRASILLEDAKHHAEQITALVDSAIIQVLGESEAGVLVDQPNSTDPEELELEGEIQFAGWSSWFGKDEAVKKWINSITDAQWAITLATPWISPQQARNIRGLLQQCRWAIDNVNEKDERDNWFENVELLLSVRRAALEIERKAD